MATGTLDPTSLPFPDSVLRDLLDVSLTGVNVLRPVYDPAGEIEDFAIDYLNPAGQRMTGLAAQPGGTLLTRFPAAMAVGILAYYRRVYADGATGRHEVNYQADGLDNYFRLAARRSGDLLVVSFTDTSDQDRSAVEQALRESQAAEQAARAETETQRQRLYHILENFPAVVASYRGPEHVFDLVSHRFQRDFPTRTIKGLPVRQALPELEGQQYYEILDGVYRTGEPFYGTELETWVDLTNTGQLELQYYNVCFQATRDAQGRIDGILNFAYDVTDAVRARQQLEQLTQELEARVQERTREAERQRRQWEQLFLRAPAAICLFNGPEWVYEFVNPGYQAMFPGRELLGQPLLEALPELRGQPLVDALRRVYDTGEPFQESEVLVPLARTEGGPIEDIYVDLTFLARTNEAGQIDGFVTFAYDVTGQVRARQERDAQQRQLRDVFEQAPVAIFVLRGLEYVFDVVNPSMAEIIGSPPEQILGQRYFDLLPTLVEQGYPELVAQVWHSGQPYVAQEQAARLPRHGEGETGYYNFTYVPLRDANETIGIMCVAVDVTPQVLARQQVQDMNQELAAINEELGSTNQQLTRTNVDLDNFIYTASHDLKAPISNIEGLLYLLQEELPPAVTQDAEVGSTLTRMLEAVERFKRTIDHLTDVSKLQKENTPATTLVNLAAVIEDVRLDLAPLVEGSGAKLVVEVDALPPVQFSEKNLRSIVYNLLSNAVKYHSPDRPPHVDVRAHVRPGHTVLEVHDNGLGIAEAQLPRLFGMFQRFHDHVDGTGIGLYMVKRMVENAGGRIEVHSQLGAGTTFFVFLPHTTTAGAPPFPAYLPS